MNLQKQGARAGSVLGFLPKCKCARCQGTRTGFQRKRPLAPAIAIASRRSRLQVEVAWD